MFYNSINAYQMHGSYNAADSWPYLAHLTGCIAVAVQDIPSACIACWQQHEAKSYQIFRRIKYFLLN